MATCVACEPEKEKKSAEGDPSTRTLSAAMIAVSLPSSSEMAKLNVRRADTSGMPEIGPIKVGDRVRSIPEK